MVFPVVMYGCENWTIKKAEPKYWCFWMVVVLGRLLRVPGLQGDQTGQSWRKSVLNIHWKDWCWSWNSNTLATLCDELIHWKRSWCWERLKAGGEGDDRGWDGWMVSLTRWTWVWANSGSWWWTWRYCSTWGCKELDTTERLNWTEKKLFFSVATPVTILQ